MNLQVGGQCDSGSGFREAFSKIMGAAPSKCHSVQWLHAAWIDSPLGPMIALADEKKLYLLEFVERRGLEREIAVLRQRLNIEIISGDNAILEQTRRALSAYFSGEDLRLNIPISMIGTPFQQTVWRALQTIPIGETISYKTLATMIGKPTAYRAVANANGCNQLVLIVPCHRVIRDNGELGGYAAGIARKEWLIAHEKNITAIEELVI